MEGSGAVAGGDFVQRQSDHTVQYSILYSTVQY